ncbi:hypothetical protein ACW6QP_05485 [Salegentibacter sp. HM20]
MKFRFLFFSAFIFVMPLQAQEFDYWNAEDFSISRNEIKPQLLPFDFGLEKSNFHIRSGAFLNVESELNHGIDMVALIERDNSYRKRTVDLGHPIAKKDLKSGKFSFSAGLRDNQSGVRNEAYESNPYYQNQRFRENMMYHTTRRMMNPHAYYYHSPYRRFY